MEHPDTEKLVTYFQSRFYIETRKHRNTSKKDRIFFSNLAEFCSKETIPVSPFDWVLYQFIAFKSFGHELAPHHLLTEKAVVRTLGQLHEMERKLGVNSLPITTELEITIFLDRIKTCMTRYSDNEPPLSLLIGLHQEFITSAQFDYAWTKSNFSQAEETYIKVHDKYLVETVDRLRSLLLNEEV